MSVEGCASCSVVQGSVQLAAATKVAKLAQQQQENVLALLEDIVAAVELPEGGVSDSGHVDVRA